jgi:hypothetical protein
MDTRVEDTTDQQYLYQSGSYQLFVAWNDLEDLEYK